MSITTLRYISLIIFIQLFKFTLVITNLKQKISVIACLQQNQNERFRYKNECGLKGKAHILCALFMKKVYESVKIYSEFDISFNYHDLRGYDIESFGVVAI